MTVRAATVTMTAVAAPARGRRDRRADGEALATREVHVMTTATVSAIVNHWSATTTTRDRSGRERTTNVLPVQLAQQ